MKDRSAQKYAVHQNKKFYASPEEGGDSPRRQDSLSYRQDLNMNSPVKRTVPPIGEVLDVDRVKAENSTIFQQMVMKPAPSRRFMLKKAEL